MPATIVSGDFIDLGTITSITETSGYDDDNVEDYWHLKRRFRATGVPKDDDDFLLKFDFGSNQSVVAVVLDDVNFDQARIRADDDDEGNDWTPSDFDSGDDHVVSLDERTDRYSIYIPAVFTRRWMIVQVPAGASAVGGYQTKWEVGRVVVLSSITELAKNTYWRTSMKAYREKQFTSGGFERVGLGDMRWEGTLGFDVRKASDEDVLWALNNMASSDPMILYENNSDTSKVYVCARDDSYEGKLDYHNVARGSMIKFKELV